MSVSHVGLRVRDLEKSTQFYEALGFTEAKRLTVPDNIAAGLLALEPRSGSRRSICRRTRSSCSC